MTRFYGFLLSVVLSAQFFCAAYAVVQAAELPNLVVYISDDLGRLDTSVYGSPDAKTPTLDGLAATGMTFDRAYVASPSCCPNRYSLLTGLMPARHGAHPNHSQPKPGTEYLLPPRSEPITRDPPRSYLTSKPIHTKRRI